MTQKDKEPDDKKDKEHHVQNPMWGILVLAVLLGWLTVTLWTQAAKFDSTEGRAIVLFISPLVAGWCWWFFRWKQS